MSDASFWRMIGDQPSNYRKEPDVTGAGGGKLTSLHSPDRNRTSSGRRIPEFTGSGTNRRFGVKPNTGDMGDCWTPPILPDDPYLTDRTALTGLSGRLDRHKRLIRDAQVYAAGELERTQEQRDWIASECDGIANYKDQRDLAMVAAVRQAVGI